jgi:hypothetical protein
MAFSLSFDHLYLVGFYGSGVERLYHDLLHNYELPLRMRLRFESVVCLRI